jgi:hypothetical protein
MGLFVVARLAARHGIRVRLRPASMGGLTALVWLPDEAIVHETGGVAAGLRRLGTSGFGDGSAGAAGLGASGSARGTLAEAPAEPGFSGRHAAGQRFSGDWPEEPSALAPAPAAARVPRFTNGTTDSAIAAEPGATVGVIVPPAVGAAEENRLPIFESVESDWFRRSRQGDVPVAGAPAEDWSSPADEGWRAAEVVQAPVSDGLTSAGLPQRVPRANLVPGRAGPLAAASAASAAPAPAPARSAAQTQARLASFQQAVRDARAAAQAGGDEPGPEEDNGQPGQAD